MLSDFCRGRRIARIPKAQTARLPLQRKGGLPSRSLGEGWFAERGAES